MKPEEKMDIEQTTDYSKFKFYDFNRPINKSLVKRLKSSINEIGFIKGNPILVDKDFAIKDGQHRFTALMELGMPIYYYVVKGGDAHKIVTLLNAEQVRWTIDNYVHAWAEEGLSCYKKLEEFGNKYNINMSQAVIIFFKGSDDGGNMNGIKAGKHYSINPEHQRIMDFMMYCKDIVPYWKGSFFVRALVRLFKVITDEQVEKLKKGIIALPQQVSAENYMISFENLVNKGVSAHKRVSFRLKT
jgi:hypothetical protein